MADPDTVASDGSAICVLIGGADGGTRTSLCEVGLRGRGLAPRESPDRRGDLVRARGTWPGLAGPRGGTADLVSVAPGDALVIPTGWRLQFSAAPDTDLRFLCPTAPPLGGRR